MHRCVLQSHLTSLSKQHSCDSPHVTKLRDRRILLQQTTNISAVPTMSQSTKFRYQQQTCHLQCFQHHHAQPNRNTTPCGLMAIINLISFAPATSGTALHGAIHTFIYATTPTSSSIPLLCVITTTALASPKQVLKQSRIRARRSDANLPGGSILLQRMLTRRPFLVRHTSRWR